ncbi:hypothetical protein IMZ48_18780 [Candidatus Bathyarchaeota archaeon]|nr:hypothetical protein [Candidatus Bathyarchaeota archaeon]
MKSGMACTVISAHRKTEMLPDETPSCQHETSVLPQLRSDEALAAY